MPQPAQRRRLAFPALVLSACLAACAGARGNTADAFGPRSEGPLTLAWVVPYEDSLASLERNAPYVRIVSPTYYRLRVSALSVALEDWDPTTPFPRARIGELVAKGLIAKASVLPLVGCIGACGPQISRVLDDPGARAKHVTQLLESAETQGLAGLFVDYEDVDAKKESVTDFVQALSQGLHAAGRTLGFVIQEPCGASVATCARSPYPFDLRAIASNVDVLAIMEYDYAVDGSAAPAPRSWVRAGLTAVANAVGTAENRAKTVCAVPLYGRATAGMLDDSAVLYSEVLGKRAGSKSFETGVAAYDDDAIAMVAPLRAGGREGKVYYENHDTFARRLNLISEVKLGGVAMWRLGGEDPCITSELARYRGMPLASSRCGTSLQK